MIETKHDVISQVYLSFSQKYAISQRSGSHPENFEVSGVWQLSVQGKSKSSHHKLQREDRNPSSTRYQVRSPVNLMMASAVFELGLFVMFSQHG